MEAKVMKEIMQVNSFTHIDICTLFEANNLSYDPKFVILISGGSDAEYYLYPTVTLSVGKSVAVPFYNVANPISYGGAYTLTMTRLSSGKVNIGFRTTPPFASAVRLVVFG